MIAAAADVLTSQLIRLGQATQGSAERYLASARAVLTHLVANPNLVDASAFPRNANGFSRNLIAHGEGISVWAMVWSAGARTPIHDHHCSCCFGVLTGTIGEKWFRAIGEDRALLTGQEIRRPGYVACMMPSGPNIHQMVNDAADEAVSIHIYGYDHEMHASSIDRVYRLATD